MRCVLFFLVSALVGKSLSDGTFAAPKFDKKTYDAVYTSKQKLKAKDIVRLANSDPSNTTVTFYGFHEYFKVDFAIWSNQEIWVELLKPLSDEILKSHSLIQLFIRAELKEEMGKFDSCTFRINLHPEELEEKTTERTTTGTATKPLESIPTTLPTTTKPTTPTTAPSTTLTTAPSTIPTTAPSTTLTTAPSTTPPVTSSRSYAIGRTSDKTITIVKEIYTSSTYITLISALVLVAQVLWSIVVFILIYVYLKPYIRILIDQKGNSCSNV